MFVALAFLAQSMPQTQPAGAVPAGWTFIFKLGMGCVRMFFSGILDFLVLANI